MGCTGRKIRREGQRDQVGEVTVLIIGVHCIYLLGHGRTENLENLTYLSLGVFSGEKWAHLDKLGDDASSSPYIDLLVVESLAEDQFRGAIVTRADV